MLLKSLQILAAAALLTLAAIVTFALLRLSGPDDMLAEAEALLARGELVRGIAIADLAERSAAVLGDPERRERLWRLRYGAYMQIDNAAGALRDVELLLEHGCRDDDLLLDRVRLLALTGAPERALDQAKQFLAERPDHGRGLELAGEAAQMIYQRTLRSLLDTLDREIGRDNLRGARAALLAYLYCPAGDPEVQHAADDLRRAFSSDPRLATAWPPLWQLARRGREQVQLGLGFFQRCLEVGDEPVAAIRALATAYDRAGRFDDLLLLAELQRRRLTSAYSDEPGAMLVWTLLREGLNEAALAAGARWQPRGVLVQRVEQDLAGPATEDLLLARVVAAHRLGDPDLIRGVASDIYALRAAGDGNNKALPALTLSFASQGLLDPAPDYRQVEERLYQVVNRALAAPAPVARPDLAAEFLPLLADVLAARGAGETERIRLLKTWQEARPTSLEPGLLLATYLLDLGRVAGALVAAEEAAAIAPQDPRLFRLRLAIARQRYRDTDLDGPGLLAQCLRLRTVVPEISDPLGYLLCAEAAATQRLWHIAAACARRASDTFLHAIEPRRLELDALLQLGRHSEAALAADRLLADLPTGEVVPIGAITAFRAAGRPTLPLLREVLPRAAPSPALGTELLRAALAGGPGAAAPFVMAAPGDDSLDRETCCLAATAMARAGQVEAAGEWLARATRCAPLPAAARGVAAAAFAAFLTAAAAGDPDDSELAAAAIEHWLGLDLGSEPQHAVLAAAAELAEQLPRTACSALQRALPAAAPEDRNGARFALAGRLALRCGRWRAAEEHLLAALAFPDGRAAAEPLARLLLATNRPERAAEVYRIVAAPTDPALAARFDRLEAAGDLLADALLRDPADLLVHAGLAAIGTPSLADWTSAPPALQRQRLDLVVLLADPDLAPLVVARARSLADQEPTSRTTWLLLARALRDAGEAPAAGALHALMHRGGSSDQVFWREVALAARTPGYQPTPELHLGLVHAAHDAPDAAATTRAAATDYIVAVFAAGGFTDEAERARLTQLLSMPERCQFSRADLDLLARRASPRQAFHLLDRLLADQPVQRPPRVSRRLLLEQAMAALTKLYVANPANRDPLRASARRYLDRFGPLGCIVRFLLETPGSTDVEAVALASDHLEAVLQGQDDDGYVLACIGRLAAILGADEVLLRVEKMLDRQPTALPLWLARSRLRLGTRTARDALRDLRRVLDHAATPAIELEYLVLAGATHTADRGDSARFAALPAALRDGPRGRLAQGLFALRRGDAADALRLLGDAAGEPDGRHLFATALAWLQTDHREAEQRCREQLQVLARDYPSSPLARSAGSFLRQLEPRAATAADREPKR